jgi:putative DNA primase/helicase
MQGSAGMITDDTEISSSLTVKPLGYGARETEWKHFEQVLGLTADMLPVVSDPSVLTSPSSKIPDCNRGKVPSVIRRGMVGGITGWSSKRSTVQEVAAWSKNPALGIGIKTREVRAIDIDIADAELSQQVVDWIEMFCGALPKRMRNNSGKCLLAFRMSGCFNKLMFKTSKVDNSKIEFLADGQLFVAAGTHPSGARYEWEGGLPAAIPTLRAEEFAQLWDHLRLQFAVEQGALPIAAAMNRINSRDAGDLDRISILNQVTEETMDDLRSALAVFSEDDVDNYDLWVSKLGHALKSLEQAGRGQDALDMWHEMSAKSPRYYFDEAQAKWETFAPNRISYKTIFQLAADRGWLNPKSTAALKANATAATRLDRTDAGNVALLASQVDGNLRFVPERRTWLWWDGARWSPDTYGTAAQAAALEVAEHYHSLAAEFRKQTSVSTLDDRERKRIEQAAESVEKWAAHCRNKKVLDSMLALAKGDERFTLAVSDLDRDPWLFGVENGVVDLRSGLLREASRDEFVTRRAPVRFYPNKVAPRWMQFIEEITAKPTGVLDDYKARPELAAYMQRALGYAMTGSTVEHKMFIAIGEGSNGKNVLLDHLQWLMGDYCETIPPEALMATRHDADAERPSPTAATLAGARAAISSESKDGQRLDVALVKRHTGGGYMTARYLRENTFRFEISHKLWLMTNHRPALDHMDEAMRGRLHLIPFDMQWNRPGHPDRNPNLPDGDKALPDKLKQEAEGVLAWLVKGAVDYVRDGLEPPIEVVNMTRDFFKDQDPLGRWLDTCMSCDVKLGARAAQLFESFRGWQQSEDEEGRPVSQKYFSTALAARGVAKHVDGEGVRYALQLPKTGNAE